MIAQFVSIKVSKHAIQLGERYIDFIESKAKKYNQTMNLISIITMIITSLKSQHMNAIEEARLL